MSFAIEVEEWAGSVWHKFITRKADPEFPEFKVELEPIQNGLALLFRAMGGGHEVSVEAAQARQMMVKRSFLQKVAGTARQLTVAWRDAQSVRLPPAIATYPEERLNLELYRWLTILSAHAGSMQHWGRDNQRWIAELMDQYPALQKRYTELVLAHLALRPEPKSLPPDEAKLEEAIRQALLKPGTVDEFPGSERAPWPVALWLYPPLNLGNPQQTHWDEEDGDMLGKAQGESSAPRKQASRVEDNAGKQGLLVFRLENLFTWTEHVDLDRTGDDNEDIDAARVADDLDEISLSKKRKRKGGGLKLHLDLPPADIDDIPLGEGIKMPEWDFRRNELRKDFANVEMMQPRLQDAMELPEHLQPLAKKVRRQFEHLRAEPQWLRQQTQGSELDLQACVDFQVERKLGNTHEPGLFMDRRRRHRDLSCLALADLSMSTDAHVNNEKRVIDVVGDSLMLFAEALSVAGDDFSLYGFSSLRRHHVRMLEIKGFDQKYNANVCGAIQSLKPGYYTRMGTAIRRATQLLEKRPHRRKLLLLITDGKPNDLDLYEGRYGVEDTRHAVMEARKAGLIPFCITIDQQAGDYLPYMFGANGYTVIKEPVQLPTRLPQLYRLLTEP
ncbi:MAG: VWA domain-containing protein [Gammaproteobacteria bacterium]|jgi:nitric oxide reductase NorD protein|nr:VWA domain-containing protein [Gammaproteobacteria bacterium]